MREEEESKIRLFSYNGSQLCCGNTQEEQGGGGGVLEERTFTQRPVVEAFS